MLMNDNGITREMTQAEIDAIMADVPAPIGYEETDEPIEEEM